jgi:hypothetical protein
MAMLNYGSIKFYTPSKEKHKGRIITFEFNEDKKQWEVVENGGNTS